ncbi:MAG TPA: GatB/YqeY domain-containing protein, partial [Blastocatellia bacterium]|nr:GatB/YqeY domain-containing protein [Blastocatellia bacterium]
AAEQYRSAGRADLAEKEENEARVLEAYLPASATEEELSRAVEEAIKETGATSPKDMGAVMKSVRPRLEGKTVDGKALSDMVKARLATADR